MLTAVKGLGIIFPIGVVVLFEIGSILLLLTRPNRYSQSPPPAAGVIPSNRPGIAKKFHHAFVLFSFPPEGCLESAG